MSFMKVDGVEIPCPSVMTWNLNEVSAAESGRTDDGLMHKNRITQKRTLNLTWNALTFEEASEIIKAFNPEYVQVEYPDLLTGNTAEVRTFYTGDKSVPFYSWWDNKKIMESLSFDIIER